MPRIELTPQLRRFTGAAGAEVEGTTVREALDAFFEIHPNVRSYVVDEHGAVRRHVVVFLNGQQLVDRTGLGESVGHEDELHIFQALSGG